MPQVIDIRRGDRPRSFGEILAGAVISGMQAHQAEKERRRQEGEQNRREAERSQDRDLSLQEFARSLMEKRAATVVPGAPPVQPEAETLSVPSRSVTGPLDALKFGPEKDISMTGPAPVRETVDIPGVSVGGRLLAPAEKVGRTYESDVQKKNAQALMDSLNQLGMKTDLQESIKAKYKTPAKAEKTSEFEDFLKSKYGDSPTARQRLSGRREWAAAERKPEGGPGDQPRPGRLTKEERQQFASTNYVLPKLSAFAEYVKANPDKYGKWDAFAANLRQQVPGMADADYANKKAFIGRMNAEIRHALFGASLTAGEQESAKSFMIDETDQPAVILAKLQDARGRMQSDIDYYEGQGYKVGAGKKAAPAGPAKKVGRFTVEQE